MPAWAGTFSHSLRDRRASVVLLVALLGIAGALRWNNLDWDQGHLFHPDERHILMVTARLALPFPLDLSLLLSPNSPLNPRDFAYGSLPFYLLKLTSHILAFLGGLSPALAGLRNFSDFDHLRLVGRFLSGLFDLGSIAIIYMIGVRLWSRKVGLLAAAFLTFTVIDIQYAHFYASDSQLTFFVLLATLLSFNLLRSDRIGPVVATGIAVGLALASKFSAMPVLAVIVAAVLLRVFLRSQDEDVTAGPSGRLQLRVPDPATLNRALLSLLVLLFVAGAVFLAVEPYALIDFSTFSRNLAEQNAMVRGFADLPYTRQYANTPPYWYFVWNLLVFGMGIPLGFVVLAGALAAIVKTALRPRKVELLLMAWVLPYFAITGGFHAKFLRYLLPLAPFLCLLAAYALLNLPRWVASWKSPSGDRARNGLRPSRAIRLAVGAATVIALAGGLLYALAFQNVYAGKHTAVLASEWMYKNISAGSTILTEHWEEGLPVPLRLDGSPYDAGRQGYKMLSFAGYEPDNPAKLSQIVQQVRDADYVVFFSNRLYNTIPRLPQRYPVTSRYYELLFGEQLGFRLEAYFTAYPSILGITQVEDTFGDPKLPVPAALASFRPTPLTIVPGKADESFSVYDHPKVLIFRKTERLDEARLQTLFMSQGLAPAAPPGQEIVSASPPKPLLLSEARRAADTAGGTFRDFFNRYDLANQLPVPVWVALIVVLGALGAPIAFGVFRHLPDRGHLLAKPLAILALVWLDWVLVSLGLVTNTRGTALLALILLAAVSAVFAWRQWPAMRQHYQRCRRLLLAEEVLFWGAFALFLAIRMANPDLWHPARGGEKPMDLAYLMATIKSSGFPPYDPWFAGGHVNYYYYGQLIAATLIKISGIVPTIAYNLVVPLLFALTAGGVFSAAYGLLVSRGKDRGIPFVIAVAGTLMAVVFGNLGGATQLIAQIARVGQPGLQSNLPALEGLTAFFGGLWRLFSTGQALQIPSDWYWASTRVLDGTINEFPFFTFLYADLHAHLLALPFTMLALCLAIDVVKGARMCVTAGRRAETQAIHSPSALVSFRGTVGSSLASDSSLLESERSPASPAKSPPSLVQSLHQDTVSNSLPSILPNEAKSSPSGFEAPLPDLDIDRSSAAALPNEAKSSPRTIYSSALSFHDLVPAEPFSDTPNPNLSWLRKLLWLLPAALVIGALMPTNSWDFPTYLAIYCATLLVAWYFKRPLSLGGLGWIGLQGSLLFILSYVLYWPFHANFQQWYLGVDQIRDKSDLMGYLRIHGLFIFAIASYLLVETGRRYGRSAPLRGFGLWMRWWDHLPRLISLQRHLVRRTDGRVNLTLYAVAMVLALLLAIHVIGMTLVALLLGLLLWTAVLALHRDNPPEVLFSQVLVAVGFALSILVELVALKGDIGRMNTVFKFYLQIWMLWSVAAVICLTYTWRLIGRHWSVAWRQAWAIALAVLISAAIVYPLIATGARIRDRFDPSIPPTLDGTAFIERAVYRVENPQTKQGRDVRLRGDLAAIRWLQDNVAGSPVILEGWAPLYQWGARYSIYAGLPTVIGWDWHQKQQRWGYQVEVDRRLADVRTMYDTPAIEGATSLMDKYDVRYVVVGDLERVMYAAAGLAKFDQMVGRYLEVAYDSEGVKIYRRLKRE